MKDSEIHIGLDKAEIRDVIAKGLIATYENEGHVYSYMPGRTRLEEAQERLRIAQLNFEAVKAQEGYVAIMESFGWEEHDVSDEVGKDPSQKFYRSFIGTQEEFDSLMKDIESVKYDFRKGDRVRYRIPQDGDPEFVYTRVRQEAERINFPTIELQNGHTARWNGEKYMIDTLETELEKE